MNPKKIFLTIINEFAPTIVMNLVLDLFTENEKIKIIKTLERTTQNSNIPPTLENDIEIVSQLFDYLLRTPKQYSSEKYDSILRKMIKKNTDYITSKGYNNLPLESEELKEALYKDLPIATYQDGVSADMLILYYYSNFPTIPEKIKNTLKKYFNESEKEITEYEKKYQPQLTEKEKEIAKMFKTKFKDEKMWHEFLEHTKHTEIHSEIEKEVIALSELIHFQYDKEKGVINNFPSAAFIYLLDHLIEIIDLGNTLYAIRERLALINARNSKNKDLLEKRIQELLDKEKEIPKLRQIINEQKKEIENLKQKLSNKKPTPIDKLEKENEELKKKINHYLSRIEKLQEEIALLNEAKEINQTLQENIEVNFTENISVIPKILIKKISIQGGKWNSTNKEKLTLQLQEIFNDITINFIQAEDTFKNIDLLKESDLIIIDTSYNAHKYTEKIKSINKNFLLISQSNPNNIIEKITQKITS